MSYVAHGGADSGLSLRVAPRSAVWTKAPFRFARTDVRFKQFSYDVRAFVRLLLVFFSFLSPILSPTAKFAQEVKRTSAFLVSFC